MRLLLITACLILAAAALSGCNTIKGFGTDVHDIAQNTQLFFEDASGYTTDSHTPSPNSVSRSVNARTSY